MRILYFAELFWPNIGGLEVISSQLLPALREKGHEFAVITSNTTQNLPETEEWNGIPIHRFFFLKALAAGNVSAISEVRQRLTGIKTSFKPDIVHLNSADAGALFHFFTGKAWPAPSLHTIHAFPKHDPRQSEMQKKVLRTVDWVVGISHAVLDEARRIAPEIRNRSSLIYQGSPDCISVSPAPLSFDPPRVLCMGRLIPDKGFDLAISAFALVLHRFPAARLTVSGDGPEMESLRRLARDLGIAGNVDFTGWIMPERTWDAVNDSTLVVVPSRWQEPLGLVALQASQMARPLVVPRVGGLPEIVEHERTGLVVTPEDSEALANAVISLLERPETARELGRAGLARFREVFGWRRLIDSYDALYRKLVRGQ